MSEEHPFPSSREGIGSEESGTNYVYISWLDILKLLVHDWSMNALQCQVRTGQNCSVYFLNLENGRYSTKTPASTSWYSVSLPDCTHAGCQVKMVWLSSAIWGKVHNRQHYFACTPAGGWENVEQMPELALGTVKLNKGNLENLTSDFRRSSTGLSPKMRNLESTWNSTTRPLWQLGSSFRVRWTTRGSHPRLVCNWDQVWTLSYEPLRRVAFKRKENHGQRPVEEICSNPESWIECFCVNFFLSPKQYGPKTGISSLGITRFFCISSCSGIMVYCWFGARWFGFDWIPKNESGIGFLKGTPGPFNPLIRVPWPCPSPWDTWDHLDPVGWTQALRSIFGFGRSLGIPRGGMARSWRLRLVALVILGVILQDHIPILGGMKY